MAEWLKIITAGPLRTRIICPTHDVDAPIKRRGSRVNPTAPSQEFYNLKQSYRELELYLYANFTRRDYLATFTYDDAHLPTNKDAAERGPLKRFIGKTRRVRKRRGEELKYVYCTEGLHGKAVESFLEEDSDLEDRRLHHHFVVNNTGPGCVEEIRSLWTYGHVRIEPLDIHYFGALARYMTKEAREFGREKPGKRSWKRSMNLTKYTVEYMQLPDGLTLTPPEGAVDYTTFHDKNPYGFADCIGDRYLLLDKEPIPQYSYTQGPVKRKPPNN